jgi:hypothetical protein
MMCEGGSRRCNATRADGEGCRAWTVRGSEPPLCAAHLGMVGAPAGNRNREAHGFYRHAARDLATIDDLVEDAMAKQGRLAAYIDNLPAEAGAEELCRLLALYGQNVSRLGRLLRDQRALSGESADGLLDAIGKALDEISTELGVAL